MDTRSSSHARKGWIKMEKEDIEELIIILLPYFMMENPDLFDMTKYEEAKRRSEELLNSKFQGETQQC